jgi:pyridoxine kinase
LFRDHRALDATYPPPPLLSLADVGNKAAVFPLQLLGFDVDIINSVQFSNHTGYPFGFEGEVLDGSRLLKLIDGMERNGLLSSYSGDGCPGRIGNILTGYIGSESFLIAVVSVVQKLKGLNPKCRYVCDPVLGDNNEFYVPRGLVDIYKREVLPLADVITPNQFEIEQLTGIAIRSIQDAQRACCVLHDMGVNLVLITSIVFPGSDENSGGDCERLMADDTTKQAVTPPPDSIAMFASRRKCCLQSSLQRQSTSMDQSLMMQQEEIRTEHNNITYEQYILYTPRFAGQFTGTGDLCAALFLGWTAADGSNQGGDDSENSNETLLSCSLEKLAGTMHAIVKRTAAASSTTLNERANAASSHELQLIQGRDDILNPPRLFRAMRVPATNTDTTSNWEGYAA